MRLPKTWNGSLLIYAHHDEPGPDRYQAAFGPSDESQDTADSNTGEADGAKSATKPGDKAAADGEGDADNDSDAKSATSQPSIPAAAGQAAQLPDEAEEYFTGSIADPVEGPVVAPAVQAEGDELADLISEAGFALAGIDAGENGWDIPAQVQAAQEVNEAFEANIGTPNRVYFYGSGTGGLAAVRAAEQDLEWLDGVAAICAPLAGATPTFDLALDAAAATKALVHPRMRLARYLDQKQAKRSLRTAVAKLQATNEGLNENRGMVRVIRDLVVAAPKNAEDAGSPEADIRALANMLALSTLDRYELEQAVSGNPSANFGTDYRARLTADQIDRLSTFVRDGDERVTRWINKVQDSARVKSDAGPSAQLSGQADVTGRPSVPIVALHTQYDEVYPINHLGWYQQLAQNAGTEYAARFVPILQTTNDANGGRGHCNHTAGDVTALLKVLNEWVRDGKYPGRVSMEEAFAVGSGVSPQFGPPAWPVSRLSPLDTPLPDQASAIGQAGTVPESANDGEPEPQ